MRTMARGMGSGGRNCIDKGHKKAYKGIGGWKGKISLDKANIIYIIKNAIILLFEN